MIFSNINTDCFISIK